MSARGRFITLEGGEGAGKSTQARLLAERLEARGVECVTTREPGGSPGAEALRTVLLSGVVAPLGPMAEAMLFAAARIDHLDHTIRPALARGAFVVCDRFADSTRVYQGVQGNIDPARMRALEQVTVGETRPDLTLILDLPAEVGLARASVRRGREAVDRFEKEGMAFHEGLRRGFLDIAKQEPRRCVVIDASRDQQTISDAIWEVVAERFQMPERRGAPSPESQAS
jgi:dTMP kinase